MFERSNNANKKSKIPNDNDLIAHIQKKHDKVVENYQLALKCHLIQVDKRTLLKCADIAQHFFSHFVSFLFNLNLIAEKPKSELSKAIKKDKVSEFFDEKNYHYDLGTARDCLYAAIHNYKLQRQRKRWGKL